jgi:hypothetical protein
MTVSCHPHHGDQVLPRPTNVGLVVDGIVLAQVFLGVIWFSYQCHSTGIAYSFIHMSMMIYNLLNSQHR